MVRKDVRILIIWCYRLFFLIKEGCSILNFQGNSQGNWKSGKICIFRACGVENSACVDLLVAAVELGTFNTMRAKKQACFILLQ